MNQKMKQSQKSIKVKLGVNIDHAATLRQVRGGTTSYPDLLRLAKLCLKAGADQITIHLREDRRHIQDRDLHNLSSAKGIPINLEMAATDEMVRKALKYQPEWVCFVPEKRDELTTEGGLNVVAKKNSLKAIVKKLKKENIKVSMFIEADLEQVAASQEVGADACEFHTGQWVVNPKKEFSKLCKAAKLCHSLGMRVHAGHGLDLAFTKKIKKLPYLQEVNIGHSIICFSLEWGIFKTVKKFKTCLKS
jgi:pyridoxine 5-phosphate synthase